MQTSICWFNGSIIPQDSNGMNLYQINGWSESELDTWLSPTKWEQVKLIDGIQIHLHISSIPVEINWFSSTACDIKALPWWNLLVRRFGMLRKVKFQSSDTTSWIHLHLQPSVSSLAWLTKKSESVKVSEYDQSVTLNWMREFLFILDCTAIYVTLSDVSDCNICNEQSN